MKTLLESRIWDIHREDELNSLVKDRHLDLPLKAVDSQRVDTQRPFALTDSVTLYLLGHYLANQAINFALSPLLAVKPLTGMVHGFTNSKQARMHAKCTTESAAAHIHSARSCGLSYR